MGSFFKPKQTTQKSTSTFTPSAQQLSLINPAVTAAQNYLANPINLSGSTIPGFNPNQTAGQNMVLGSIPGMQGASQSGLNASNFLLNDVLDPASNPALQGTIDAAVRPIYDNLMRRTLPGIRGEAITGGQYGGSRQGIAEGLASGQASQAAGDTAAGVANQGYLSGLNAQGRALGLLPQTMQASMLPGMASSAVGAEQWNLAQQQLQEQQFQQIFNQMSPWLAAQEVANLGFQMPGGTATNTGPGVTQPSMFQRLFGGGAALAGFFGKFPGMGGGGMPMPATGGLW